LYASEFQGFWVWFRHFTKQIPLPPAEGMNVYLLSLYVVLCCVGRGLCDGLITRSEESFRASNYVRLRNLSTEDKAQIWAVVS
jgi:hypothetical protein